MVQGVSFRSYTIYKAKGLGLTGWVRNLPDGRVEVLAEGEDGAIGELVKFLNKGPPAARVKEIKIKDEEFKNEFDDFGVR